MSDKVQERITAQEFTQLPETNQLTELIQGVVYMSPSPSDAHQDAVLIIATDLRHRIDSGRIKIVPLDLHLDEGHVVQPDIFWAGRTGGACQFGDDGRWHGAPDLIVEVLSPATAARDRGAKFRLYESHGVRQYWLVDPIARYLEVYTLREGQLQRVDAYTTGDTFEADDLQPATIHVAAYFD